MGGDGGVCADLGLEYDGGKSVSEDQARAAFFYGRACDLGHPMGCSGLGYLYSVGSGGLGKDEKRAAELYDKACNGSPQKEGRIGCFFLGMSLLDGRGVEKDPTRAVAVLKRACKGMVPDACVELGQVAVQRKLWQSAAFYFAKACDFGKADACGRMGRLLVEGKDLGETNMGAVKRLLKLGCDKGNNPSCEALQTLKKRGSASPSATTPTGTVRFRCPGGEKPSAVRTGCMCGDKILNPCKTGGTFPTVEGDACVFVCPDPSAKLPAPKTEMENCIQECNNETGWRFMGQCQMTCEDKVK